MNGLDFFSSSSLPATAAVEDDDDWGDFVATSNSALSSTESLPLATAAKPSDPFGFSMDRKVNGKGTETAEAAKPNSSERSRIGWEKLRGPVPLSVFGEAEEEEEKEKGKGSGLADASMNFEFYSLSNRTVNDNKKKGSENKLLDSNKSVGIDDLIANLYRNSQQVKPENESKSSSGSDMFRGGNAENSVSWDWSSLNLNGNLPNLARNGVHMNGDSSNLDVSGGDSSKKVSDSVIGSQNSIWKPLSLDAKRLDPERNVLLNSSAGGVNAGLNELNSPFVNQKIDNGIDEDDGWEFRTADSKLQSGDEPQQENEKKTENGPTSESNISNLSWNVLSSGSSGMSPNNSWDWGSLNLNRNLSNSSVMVVHENGGMSSLDLNGLDSSKNVSDSAIGSENLSWNPLDLDAKRSDSEKEVLHSRTSVADIGSNGLKSGFREESLDVDEDDGWEFKTAQSKLQSGDEPSKNEKKTENGQKSEYSVPNMSWNVLSSDLKRMNPNVTADASKLGSDLGAGDEDSWANDGWEFKGAEPEATKVVETTQVEGEDQKDVKGAEFAFGLENRVQQNGDSLAVSNQNSSGWGFGFDFNPTPVTQNEAVYYLSSESKQNEGGKGPNLFPNDGNVDSEEDSWDFRDAFSGTATKPEEESVAPNLSYDGVDSFASDTAIQKKELELEKPKEPLPLSLFGDEELENDDPSVHEDISASVPASSLGDQSKKLSPNISISDLISSLYSQAEVKTSVNLTEKHNENGFSSMQTVNDPNLANSDDEFDDDSWEFKGSSQNMMDCNIAKDTDDLDDDSWEFKSVFSGNGTETQVPGVVQQREKYTTKVELKDYLDLYTKLKNELCYIALNYLNNLKKARSSAAGSDEGNGVISDQEIQDLRNQLHQDILVGGGVNIENLQPKSVSTDEFIQVLQEPTFRSLELEYRLSERLLSAEKDWKSLIELLKHAVLTLKILNSGSVEEQSNYVSTWSRILSVCAQELQHGACIWKQALEKKVHDEILSKPQGKKYLLALGGVYRVAEILGASARLYKPWILLNPEANVMTLLNECRTSWSSSGLQETLQSISNLSGSKYDGYASALMEFIEHVHDLDAFALYDHIFSGRGPICRISGLTAAVVSDMKLVAWNGDHYFLTLANLWANLISVDPPSIPHIHLS